MDKEKGPGAAFSNENNPQKLARGMLAKTEAQEPWRSTHFSREKCEVCKELTDPSFRAFESRTGSMLFLSTAVLGPCNFCPAKLSSNK